MVTTTEATAPFSTWIGVALMSVVTLRPSGTESVISSARTVSAPLQNSACSRPHLEYPSAAWIEQWPACFPRSSAGHFLQRLVDRRNDLHEFVNTAEDELAQRVWLRDEPHAVGFG